MYVCTTLFVDGNCIIANLLLEKSFLEALFIIPVAQYICTYVCIANVHINLHMYRIVKNFGDKKIWLNSDFETLAKKLANPRLTCIF